MLGIPKGPGAPAPWGPGGGRWPLKVMWRSLNALMHLLLLHGSRGSNYGVARSWTHEIVVAANGVHAYCNCRRCGWMVVDRRCRCHVVKLHRDDGGGERHLICVEVGGLAVPGETFGRILLAMAIANSTTKEKWSEVRCGCGHPITLFSFNHWLSIGPKKPRTCIESFG